jgi:hypothetical protein
MRVKSTEKVQTEKPFLNENINRKEELQRDTE